jgi:hypothetical protein
LFKVIAFLIAPHKPENNKGPANRGKRGKSDHMTDNAATLGWIAAAGTPGDLGRALGRAGQDAMHRHIVNNPLWHQVNSPRHLLRLSCMAATVQTRFPAIWAELQGLAEGLELPFGQVMAWNCRGDLLATSPDGCTTVLLPGDCPVLAHNEDGFPFLRGACFIAQLAPVDAPTITAFCYPGSIPGHTFAFTGAGLVQTVNNIRLIGVTPDVPRMVLGRATLAATTLEQAVDTLRACPNSGGFHLGLSHLRDRRILSVEYGAGQVSVREITAPAIHANHALHHPGGPAGQIVTQSSADRQRRGEELLNGQGADPLAILRDTDGPGLPIRRDAPDDPDDENTHATAVFRFAPEGLNWAFYTQTSGPAAYVGLSRPIN